MSSPKTNIEAYVGILFGVANDTDVDENLTTALVRIACDIQREASEIDRLFTAACHALRPPDSEQIGARPRTIDEQETREPTSPAEPADEDEDQEDKVLDGFNRAWLAYLQAKAAIQKQVAGKEDITGEASDAENDAMWGLIKVQSPTYWVVKHKLEVLLHLFDPSKWADGRDVMLAASSSATSNPWNAQTIIRPAPRLF